MKSIIKNRKALVFIGASKIAANSPMRGYIRSPQRALLKAMKIYADVVLVDKFRTTMPCSQKNCHQMVRTSRSPKRYQFCLNCGTNWNRDVNAGNNILYVGLQNLLQREVHPNFQRGINLNRVSFSTSRQWFDINYVFFAVTHSIPGCNGLIIIQLQHYACVLFLVLPWFIDQAEVSPLMQT